MTAVIFAAIFLSEPLTRATVVGGVGVVAAGIMVARMAPAVGSPTTGMEALAVPEALESCGTDGAIDESQYLDRSEA